MAPDNLPTIEVGDSGKEASHSTALQKIEGMLGKVLSVVFADADNTPAEDNALHNLVISCDTTALTAARNLILPSRAALWIVRNTGGSFSITAKTSVGAGVAIPAGEERFVRCDGTDIVQAGRGGVAPTAAAYLLAGVAPSELVNAINVLALAAQLVFKGNADGVSPLALKRNGVGMTADFFQWKDELDNVIGRITRDGDFNLGGRELLNIKESSTGTSAARVDQLTRGILAVVFSTSDETITELQSFSNAVIVCTGSPAADRNLIVPDTTRSYSVKNALSTNQVITVKTLAGAGIAILPGQERLVRCDGVNVVRAEKRLFVLTFGAERCGVTTGQYLRAGGIGGNIDPTEHYIPAPFAGRVWRSRLRAQAGPATKKATYTWEKNDVAQALVVDLAAAGITGVDLDPTHAFTVAEGDSISVIQTFPDGAPSSEATNVCVTAWLEEE